MHLFKVYSAFHCCPFLNPSSSLYLHYFINTLNLEMYLPLNFCTVCLHCMSESRSALVKHLLCVLFCTLLPPPNRCFSFPLKKWCPIIEIPVLCYAMECICLCMRRGTTFTIVHCWSKFSLFLVPLNKFPRTFFCGVFSWLETFIYFVPH